MSFEFILLIVIISSVSAGLGFLLSRLGKTKQVEIPKIDMEKVREEVFELTKRAREEAEKIRQDAKEEAENTLLKAEEEIKRLRSDLEKRRKEIEDYLSENKLKLQKMEQSLMQKENQLERRFEVLERREEELYRREKELRDRERGIEGIQKELEIKIQSIAEGQREIEALKQREMLELQRIASISIEEARMEVLKRAEEMARVDSIRLMKHIEDEARERAEFEAKRIISTSIQRISSDIAINYTTAAVELPNNEFKGRIIGREGRNIRTFEVLTGVDLIIDDTPDVVTISSFDPLRREIAKEALQKLIEDGRIHPARIEEVVNEVKKEMDDKIKKMGEETCAEMDLYDVNPGLYYYIGKLYFRTSYSQNVLLHSKEVAYISGLMAEELGLNAKMAKRAGLLHDIGKSISHELGGSHTDIGIELCKKYGEPDPVLNAIKAHHNEEPVRYPEVALVCAADALSAARPGARRETLEAYLKRLEKLESIVKSFKGVANAYAVQAGREVRVIVNPEEISDEDAYILSKDIAKKIEEEMEFPGQIKVVVIRETRYAEYAK